MSTQPIEESDDYTCPDCGGTYSGDDWRERRRNGVIVLICPTCEESEEIADYPPPTMNLKELIAFLRSKMPPGKCEFVISHDVIYDTQMIYAQFETIGACASHIAKELGCQQCKLENGNYKFFTTK